jgi:hypothetical protein
MLDSEAGSGPAPAREETRNHEPDTAPARSLRRRERCLRPGAAARAARGASRLGAPRHRRPGPVRPGPLRRGTSGPGTPDLGASGPGCAGRRRLRSGPASPRPLCGVGRRVPGRAGSDPAGRPGRSARAAAGAVRSSRGAPVRAPAASRPAPGRPGRPRPRRNHAVRPAPPPM